MRIRAVILAVACVSAVSSNAHADAWSVAKNVIPGGLPRIVGLDVHGSKNTVAELGIHALMDEWFEGISEYGKDKCGIDPWDRAGTVVWAADEHGKGALFIELRGTSRAEIVSCFEAGSGDIVTVVGNEIRVDDDGFAVAWIDGVLVVPVRGDDVASSPALLRRMIGGKGAGKDAILIRALREVDTTAPIWVIYGERMERSGRAAKTVQRSNPFLFAQGTIGEPVPPPTPPAEPAEATQSRGTGAVVMRYAVGEVHVGVTTRMVAKGNFKTGAADFATILRAEIADDSDLQKVLGSANVSQSGEFVQVDLTMNPEDARELLADLADDLL